MPRKPKISIDEYKSIRQFITKAFVNQKDEAKSLNAKTKKSVEQVINKVKPGKKPLKKGYVMVDGKQVKK